MPSHERLALRINGKVRKVEVDPSAPLLFVLRNQLGLMGAKLGCGLEQCGSCTVLVDGVSQYSCTAPVVNFVGRDIRTVEGVVEGDVGRRVAEAFVAETATQCGYCTPGMVVASTALLIAEPAPSEAQIREALQPHLCRCGCHVRVLRAVRRAAAGGPGNDN